MLKTLYSFKSGSYGFLLILIGIIVHYQWFNPYSRLFSWDWTNWPDKTVKGLFPFGQGTYINFYDFGFQNIEVYLNLFYILWGGIGSYVAASKLTVMIPIAILSVLSPYLLIKHLTGDKRIAFISALFFAFNTNLLYLELSHLQIAFLFSLSPLILLSFIKLIDDFTGKNLILFSLIYSVGVCYELRIAYIILVVLLVYSIIFISKKDFLKNIFRYFLLAFITTILNLFWLLPVIFSDKEAISDTTNRGLFGDKFFNLFYSLADFNHYWSGTEVQTFTLQNIPAVAWIVPILAIALLLNFKKIKNESDKKYVLFFSVILSLGILLTKQSAEPFTGLYLWLYNSFPGFNLFREASKFFILVSIGYLGLFSYFLRYLIINNKHIGRKFRFCFLATFCLLFLWNAKPLVTGEVGYLFTEKIEPAEYKTLNSFIAQQPGFFRTISFPITSKWLYFNTDKPKVSAVTIKGDAYKSFYNIPPADEKFYANFIFDPFKQNFGDYLADISAIKYFIVPMEDKQDDVYEFYGSAYQEYIQKIKELGFLQEVKLDGLSKIKVYENKNYKPYIFPLNNIYSLTSTKNLDQKFNFINSQLKNDFNFVSDSPNHKYLTVISSLFENLKEKDLSTNINYELKLDASTDENSFYTNKNKSDLYYQMDGENNMLKIYKKTSDNISINGSKVDLPQTNEIIYQNKLNSNRSYFLNVDSQIIPIQKGGGKLDTIDKDSAVKIYSTDDKNLITNASFQKGLSDKEVGDCNAYDNNPILNMKLVAEDGSDNRFLQLEAKRHIACTTNTFPVQENNEYLFKFDYQSPNAKQAGYYLEFDNQVKTVVSEKIFLSNANWNSYSKKLEVPQGATSARLYLYAYSDDENTNIINRYGNFSLQELNSEKEIRINYEPEFVKQDIKLQNDNILKYIDANYNYENLISNGSFENGLWQEKVGDCNNYDKDPKLNMSLAKEASAGYMSLQLEATRHNACTDITFEIKEDTGYLLSFDYQSLNTKTVVYYLSFNDSNGTGLQETLNSTKSSWQKLEKIIKTPKGATSATLYVYAYEDDTRANNIVRYDNFKFIEIPDLEDRFYLVSDPQLNLKDPWKVDFEIVNPTEKIVHIKGASTPFFLAMSESYHPQWQLEMNNEKVQGWLNSWIPFVKPDTISDDNHLKLNNFLNAWYVDIDELCKNKNLCTKNPDGTYDMEMVVEFTPQRWFYIGLLISGTTLLGCLGYLGYSWRKKRKSVDIRLKRD